MCLIITKKMGVKIPDDGLIYEGTSSNRDGIGIAVKKVTNDFVYIKKDFISTIDFIKWLKLNVTTEDACVIHFRYATHGLKDAGNRHPFPCSKDPILLRTVNLNCDIAVAHNGIFSAYSGKDKILSDSQLFVQDMLSEEAVVKNIHKREMQKLLEKYIGFHNKLSFILKTGEIINIGTFFDEEELQLSQYVYTYNRGFNYRTPYGGNDNYCRSTLPKNNNSCVNKEGYRGKCEYCNEERFVRYQPVEDIGFYVCKKCRRLVRRELLVVNKEFQLISKQPEKEEEFKCESCNTMIKISKKCHYMGHLICEVCFNQTMQHETIEL